MKSFSIEDIWNGIRNKLNKPLAKVGREGGVVAVGVANPPAGVVAAGANAYLSSLDTFKLNRLLIGLSSGLDQERQLNELWKYVNSSEDRAFQVGNIFKQTLASNSPKTCVLYGRILSDHIGESEKDYTREELIVCNALVNASDYDLISFKEIMLDHTGFDAKGIKRVYLNEDDKKYAEMQTTCLWGVYNRLFSSNPTEILDFGNESETMSVTEIKHRVEPPADILMQWIEGIQQVWDYGE